jgi:aryl-alcohol dehydrogenase-like predicted oxidoreductase
VRYRKLGSSDLEVSEISLGSWLTFAGGVEFEQTRACTDAAFEAGINFFDTANVYGRGAAERAWGEILSKRPRESYVLATKVWGQMSDDADDRGLSAAQIAKQIDASLARLQTDHVDLYQAHRFDPDVPIEETIEALQQVVASGKARYLGFSEWTTEQIEAAIDIAGPDLFVSSQPQYSMLWQAPEAELFPLCAANGISQIVWSPLAQGVLTGKYRPGREPPADSRAAHGSMGSFISPLMNDAILETVDRLRPIAEGEGLSMAELALAWVLRRPEVASAIVGASRPEQVFDNAKAAEIELSADTLAAMEAALAPAQSSLF